MSRDVYLLTPSAFASASISVDLSLSLLLLRFVSVLCFFLYCFHCFIVSFLSPCEMLVFEEDSANLFSNPMYGFIAVSVSCCYSLLSQCLSAGVFGRGESLLLLGVPFSAIVDESDVPVFLAGFVQICERLRGASRDYAT